MIKVQTTKKIVTLLVLLINIAAFSQFSTTASGTTTPLFTNGSVTIGSTTPISLSPSGYVQAGRLGYYGTYNSAQVQGIWSISNEYPINTTLNTFGTQYGFGYAYSTTGGAPFVNTHQILFTSNGVIGASIGLDGKAYFNGNMSIGTAPNAAYRLSVSGNTSFTGTSLFSGSTQFNGQLGINNPVVNGTDLRIKSQWKDFNTGAIPLNVLSIKNSLDADILDLRSNGQLGLNNPAVTGSDFTIKSHWNTFNYGALPLNALSIKNSLDADILDLRSSGQLGLNNPAVNGSDFTIKSHWNTFNYGALPLNALSIKNSLDADILDLRSSGQLGLNNPAVNGSDFTIKSHWNAFNSGALPLNALSIKNSNTTNNDIFDLRSNGNLGLGTIAVADAKLQVAVGGIRFQDFASATATVAATTGDRMLVADASGKLKAIALLTGGTNLYNADGTLAGNRTVTMNTNNLTFNPSTANASFFINGTNGNVGIGTTSPSEKLAVNGNALFSTGNDSTVFAKFSNDRLRVGYLNSVTPLPTNLQDAQIVMKGGGSENLFIASRGNAKSSITFHTSPGSNIVERMKITSDGNVGIGSANPDQKLTVKGKIHAEEIIVDLNVPADYVFQKYYTGKSELKADYVMPTLAEIESFTKKNNHLPNVPSAKEIQEKGVSLGEMSNVLLQKVEELTLYAIEQNKEIKRLKAENENYKSLAERLSAIEKELKK